MTDGAYGAAGYAINGQYYDLIFPEPVRDQLTAALRALLAAPRRIAEIGAGTGGFTEVMQQLLAPDGELFAVEPNPVMRTGLATRIAGLPGACERVTILPEDALTAQVPATVDAVVLFNVVMHFSLAERRQLWQRWAAALNPGGLVIVESQYPQTRVAVPPTVVPGRRVGRHRYETLTRADVLDDERITWTMTYRTRADEQVLREDTAVFDCYVISDQQLDAELTAAGCHPIANPPAGVLAWQRTAAGTGQRGTVSKVTSAECRERGYYL